jgi:hypothetical protein
MSKVSGPRASLSFLQHTDDLLFRELRSLHLAHPSVRAGLQSRMEEYQEVRSEGLPVTNECNKTVISVMHFWRQ